MQAHMHELSDEWNGEWSDERMADALNTEFGTTITPRGINHHTNWVLPHEWDLHTNVRAEPMLDKPHRDACVTWLGTRGPQATASTGSVPPDVVRRF